MSEKLKREWIEIGKIKELPENPNVMDGEKFDELVKKIEKRGFDQEIKVFWNEEKKIYEVIKGNHRLQAAIYLKYEKVPCAIGNYANRDEALADAFSDNIVKGNIDPERFTNTYKKMKDKYGTDKFLKMMGLNRESEIDKFLKTVKKTLPKEMRGELDKAAKDAKTVEDLSLILNRLFNEYGDTVKYNFMYFTYGGEVQLVVRMDKNVKDIVSKVTDKCKEQQKNINDVVGEVFKEALKKLG